MLLLLLLGIFDNAKAKVIENITSGMGEVILKPQKFKNDIPLAMKSIVLPPLCLDSKCPDTGDILMFDGSVLELKSGTTIYNNLLNGLSVSVSISNENASLLKKGKGGAIEIKLKQELKPYHSGPFSFPLLSYSNNTLDHNDTRRVDVQLDGTVRAGSCIISQGKDLRFNFVSTQNEMRQLKSRKLVERKDIGFDCVNVSDINMRFSSANMKVGDPTVLFDDATGIGVILGYESLGKKGDIPWDNSQINIPVKDDEVSIAINLYALGGVVVPGNFNLTGIYQAEYN